MGLLRSIRDTLAVTEGIFSVFMIHASRRPRAIKFRGSPAFEMTQREYFTLKYAVLHGYTIGKDGEEWELSKGDIRFRMKKESFSYVLFDDAILSHYQPIDFKGKTVLDVGGYIGDTAVLFHSLGAKKIVIYEPVEEHLPLMRKNIELNHINADVRNLGVGSSRGPLEVPYSRLGLQFGREKAGDPNLKTRTIVLEDIRTAILESHADIAKFNCETCEKAILSLDDATLQEIPLYVVETHGDSLDEQLMQKFLGAGYTIAKTTKTGSHNPLHTLKRPLGSAKPAIEEAALRDQGPFSVENLRVRSLPLISVPSIRGRI